MRNRRMFLLIPFAVLALPLLAAESDGKSRIERAIAEMDARNAAAERSFGVELSVTSHADKVRCVNGTNVWTDAINAALRDSQVVRIPASGTPYYVDGTIIVPSCRKIMAEGATISLLPPCDTVLLRNANAADGTLRPVDRSTGDRNICIVGGRWEDWQVSRKGYGRSGRFNDGVLEKGRNFYGVSALLYFGNVETLTVRDITIANAGGFAIQCGDARDALFRNIEFDGCFADGLHLNGGIERVHAQNVRGDVGDDLVALNVYDWQNSSVNFGPGDTILCEDLRLRSGYPAIRLLPGVYRFADGSKRDCRLNNVLLRNVRGVNCFKMYLQTPAYGIGTDPEWGEVGSAENLWFENVDIDLDFPPDRLGPYLTGDPVRGHFGAFEIGANVKGLNLVNVRANLHTDTYPLAHLVCAGPKSCVVKGGNGQLVELFDPWVSCTLDGVAIDGFEAVGRRPDELLHATVFEDVNHDGRSTGRGEIRGVEVGKVSGLTGR